MDRRFPKFDKTVSPKVEREINLSIQRIYDFIDQFKRELQGSIEKSSSGQQSKLEEIGNLVNGFGTQLIGLQSSLQNPIQQLGSGSVSSVGLNGVSSFITVSGSPITGSGSFTLSLVTKPANKIFAGPTTGADTTPTFRSLVAADFPIDVLLSTNSKVTAGAPFTNDGYIIVTINGVAIKLMTTA